MLAEQRADIILHELSALRTVSVSHLCQLTGASEATIRRDLNTLANLGKLSKVRGGATLAETEEVFGKMPESSRLHLAEKDRIARYAASLITNDDVVYLDAGSTVMQMVEYLQNSRALFMTNSIEAACRLTWYNLQTRVLGGTLNPGAVNLVGAEALASLGRYNFTKGFLGIDGITVKQGYTAADPEVAAVKTLAASRSQQVYVLADSSKFGQVAAVAVAPLNTARIVTNHLSDPAFRDYTAVIEV
ncbi:DeoR/GlpR family DNA-binding transcription regulator [Dysosmobacter sp.]|uniref:DeoR/GlpR family DNA-binding transcription regulator n=1 Tax=Dysosmobacter sp. TaxID=2591382 RepID=UPI003AB8DAFC